LRSDKTRATVKRLRISYAAFLIAGVLLITAGTGLTINGGQINATNQAQQAQLLLDKTREENKRAGDEYRAELAKVLSALNAAKQEQTRLLADERSRVYRKTCFPG